MTTGQMVFYGGVGLLILTILLAVVFVIKQPQYIPEQAQAGAKSNETQKLRNEYPTVPMTMGTQATELIGATELMTQEVAETELMTSVATEFMAISPVDTATENLD